MNGKYYSFWSELTRKFHRVEKTPVSTTDVERLIETVKPEPLADDEIDSIVQAVSSGESSVCRPEPEFDWLGDVDTSSVEEGVLQFNRNKGDADSDIEQRMEEIRKRALEENGDDESDVESD